MKTPKKRITFKTPRKRHTPPMKDVASDGDSDYCTKNRQVTKKRGVPRRHSLENSTNSTTLSEINSQVEEKEKKAIDLYRAENKYLRELKSDALLFKRLTGMEIVERKGTYVVSQEIMGRGGKKLIRFELREEDDAYIYKLVETNCMDLPEFLKEDISFERKEIHKFFFKVLEVLVAKNV